MELEMVLAWENAIVGWEMDDGGEEAQDHRADPEGIVWDLGLFKTED